MEVVSSFSAMEVSEGTGSSQEKSAPEETAPLDGEVLSEPGFGLLLSVVALNDISTHECVHSLTDRC